jgi:hypothetical protein
MLKVVSVDRDGQVLVETYQVGTLVVLKHHNYRFELPHD